MGALPQFLLSSGNSSLLAAKKNENRALERIESSVFWVVTDCFAFSSATIFPRCPLLANPNRTNSGKNLKRGKNRGEQKRHAWSLIIFLFYWKKAASKKVAKRLPLFQKTSRSPVRRLGVRQIFRPQKGGLPVW